MLSVIFSLTLTAFALSWWLTLWYWGVAIRRRILAIPNVRSGHKEPVPRGGGISIVITTCIGILFLLSFKGLSLATAMSLLGTGLSIAAVSFWDDVRKTGLSWRIRLLIQTAAAAWGIFWLGGLPVIPMGPWVLNLGFAGTVLGIIGLVWMANLYNFMDGIDGSAAAEAIFIYGVYAVFVGLDGHWGLAALAAIIAAAAAGFLTWNWPPARLFMGDVGAVFLGIVFGLLTLVAAQQTTVSPWTCLILLGVYVVDATITLLVRALRRQKLYEPHRTNAFHHVAARWGHKKTTWGILLINIIWLLPLAVAATFSPFHAPFVAAGAYLPLIILAVALHAGRPWETSKPSSTALPLPS